MNHNMEFLKKCWMPLIWGKMVSKTPISITILETRLVAFRDSSGKVSVFEDRCAHRGVALSGGHVIDDCLMCPYHGWRYDKSGRCVRIPSQSHEEAVPDFRVNTYLAHEQGGIVWVVLDEAKWRDEPPQWRYPGAAAALTMVEVEGNYIHLLENLVDNPHAGFIHAGLIRNEPAQRVTAEITETPLQIRIQTRGEKTNDSFLFKLLGKRGEEVDHVEEYLAPSEMVSTYSQRGRVAGVQSFIVPLDQNRTRWFFRTFLDFGPLTALVFPIYRRVVFKILMQDAEIVRQVHEQATFWPGRRQVSTRADMPTLLVAQAARAFATVGPSSAAKAQARTIEYLL